MEVWPYPELAEGRDSSASRSLARRSAACPSICLHACMGLDTSRAIQPGNYLIAQGLNLGVVEGGIGLNVTSMRA